MSISGKIAEFYEQVSVDKNHRYKSWEYCYKAFSQDEITDKDHLALHLSFYLASWGMYRGFSFLLWKDYKIHFEVVLELFKNKSLIELDFSKDYENDLRKIVDLSNWIKDWYPAHISSINGEEKIINVTDTLLTKILLGSLGCVPAYDRYFIAGMRKSGIKYSKFNFTNFMKVVKFYQENKVEFDKAQRDIKKKTDFQYPAMKLIDMYFWQIGFEIE